jgi:hypothetical protein
MKTFHCQHCGHPVFFENVQCLQCGSKLAFLPDRLNIAALEPVQARKACGGRACAPIGSRPRASTACA